MVTPTGILLIATHDAMRHAWQRALQGQVSVATGLEAWGTQELGLPEVIVADHLALQQLPTDWAQPLRRGEIGVVVVGGSVVGGSVVEGSVVGDQVVEDSGPADVVLPEDCSDRELSLACQLTARIVHLRRQLVLAERTERSLRNMAYRDPLTGLANRRQWDQQLVQRLELLPDGNPNAALGVAIIDLDLFKPLNDQCGHVAGDTVLRRVGHRLAAQLSEQHLAARLGGDEFGVLLSGVLPQDVPQVIELVRVSLADDLASDEFAGFGPHPRRLTASAGVVTLTVRDRLLPRQVLQAADSALRVAKREGRDRTVAGNLEDDRLDRATDQ